MFKSIKSFSFKNLCLGFIILFSSIPTTTAQKMSTSQSYAVSIEIGKIYSRGHINGFGVALVDKEGIVFEKGFGFANKAKQIPYSEQTLQNIASISKTFLGLALLKAQELGKLNLDDPINKYLPFEVFNPYFPEEPIILRQLTTHTSGITDSKFYDQKAYVLKEGQSTSASNNSKRPENFNAPNTYTPMAVFLKRVLSKEGEWYRKKGFIKQKPGQRFEYSNVGATLAAYILELATGEKYNNFSEKHILQPLGMTSSGWNFESINFEKHSVLYQDTKTPLPYYKLITYPDGGLITSAHDMGLYLSELIKGYSGMGSLLSKESYKELFKTQLSDVHFQERDADSPYNDEYNMGVFMGFSAKGNIGHSGGDPGVTTLMFFNKNSLKGQLLFVNTSLDEEGFKEFVAVWEKLEEHRK